MIRRNDLCPCGSGRKYKKCCSDSDEQKSLNQVKHDLPKGDPKSQTVTPQKSVANKKRTKSDFNVYDQDDDFLGDDLDDSSIDISNNRGKFPDPCPELPEISDAQYAIVQQWHDNFPQRIELNAPDEAALKILQFMKEQPDLFLHLELENEIIFQIGNGFSKRKQWNKYATFLKELRSKRPDMYQRSFEFFDYFLISDAIATNNKKAISSFFDFYDKFNTDDPEHTSSLIRLFAWTNQEEALLKFIELSKNRSSITQSGVDDEPDLYWILFTEISKHIDSNTSPQIASKQIAEKVTEYSKLDFPEHFALSIEEEIQIARSPQTNWNLKSLNNNDQISDFFYVLAWRFCSFLHHKKAMGWIKSRFIANRLLDYWIPIQESKRIIKGLRINELKIEEFLNETYTVFSGTDSIRIGAFIEGLYYLAEFLDIHKQQAEMSTDAIRKLCERMYSQLLEASDASDAIFRFPLNFLDRI
jgi:hypothetical protein